MFVAKGGDSGAREDAKKKEASFRLRALVGDNLGRAVTRVRSVP